MNKSSIHAHELREYKGRLQRLVSRLGGVVTDLRDEAFRPVGAETASRGDVASVHDADLGNRMAGEELALELLVPEEAVLADVQAALLRIANGTFGQCEECGKPIAKARLDALPYARRCIRCERD